LSTFPWYYFRGGLPLLTTEIHNHNDPAHALIVFAADRRISRGTKSDSSRQKVFPISPVNAGIGYFGLAEVPSSKRNIPMEEWLMDYLSRVSVTSLQVFAENLAVALNKSVPEGVRQKIPSGFHIAGFNKHRVPEFWYVRNLADDGQTIFGIYKSREDFQARDALLLKPGESQIYRNGDIRAHVIAWENIDKSFGSLLQLSDFKSLSTPEEYADWVKFKMEVIAAFYERYCRISMIGSPVDAFSIKCAYR
jgi:hypothetical protein